MNILTKAHVNSRSVFIALLLFALLSLQSAFLIHGAQLDDHEEDGFCELCVQGSYSKFISSASVSLFTDVAPYAATSTFVITHQHGEPLHHYAARAPPLFSF